jgi:thiol:disulfide interchange protein DsbD
LVDDESGAIMIHLDPGTKTLAVMLAGGVLTWVGSAIAGRDFSFKNTAILLLIGGVFFYRMQTPTTFAADGTDADWDAAVQSSKDSGQPTVILFTAHWCPSCQALHANVLSRSDVQYELSSHYNYYTVDLTSPSPEVQAHARKLGVYGIPCLIRYDINQQETDRTHGMDAQQMIAWLKAGE